MENEMLKTFDDNGIQIGIATREEVHRMGHWHETFHCWIRGRENGVNYLYLQLRSDLKKDYPNLLDISAAGHLLANETVCDGIREVKEEIGIDVSFQELIPLGIIQYCLERGGFIDKELANVFLHESPPFLEEFVLQKEEVSGIVKVAFDDFYEFWLGKGRDIRIQGFEVMEDGARVSIDKYVGKSKFVPHGNAYYKEVLNLMKEHKKD